MSRRRQKSTMNHSACDEGDTENELQGLVPSKSVVAPFNMPGAAAAAAATAGILISQEPFYISEIRDTVPWTFTRNDPFYANDTNVIATFDVDYKEARLEMEGNTTCIVLVLLFGFSTLISLSSKDVILISYMMILALIFVGFPILSGAIDDRKESYIACRRRIAVSRNGVYLDETDAIAGLNLVIRHSIKFEEISSCRIEDVGLDKSSYRVMIQSGPKSHCIRSLKQVQQFVDLVNAMVRKVNSVPAEAANDTGVNVNVDIIDSPAVAVAEMV